MVRLGLLLLTAATACLAAPAKNSCNDDREPFPRAHNSTVVAHDPNVIKVGDFYYLFKGGVGISKYKSKHWNGHWEPIGSVLSKPSIIKKQNATRPWAPTVLKKGDLFYCFYTVTKKGRQNSSIGVATTKDIESSDWKDHGAVIETGTGYAAKAEPFNSSNAIDPQIFIDGENGTAYLNYGSFFAGIYQVPLADDLMSVPEAKTLSKDNYWHLASTKNMEHNDVEGVFMTFKDGWYYLWFSHGRCCNFNELNFTRLLEQDGEYVAGPLPCYPATYREKNGSMLTKLATHRYSIHVARSRSVHGPFVDKHSTDAREGGGHVVYGSNHGGDIFAPGGLGVLEEDDRTVLYFHYSEYLSLPLRSVDKELRGGEDANQYRSSRAVNKNRPNGLEFKVSRASIRVFCRGTPTLTRSFFFRFFLASLHGIHIPQLRRRLA